MFFELPRSINGKAFTGGKL